MSDLDRLRERVRKRRADVTAKERRILINTGVDIKGTKEDPRRPPSVIKRYNSTQLRKYLNQLDAFMSRSNGYVPDSSGGLIKKSDWLRYKREERKLNKVVIEHFNSIANIKDPYRNVTIMEAEGLYVPNSKRAQGEIRHRPYNIINRNSKNIKDSEALAKLEKQVKGKLDKSYLPKAIQAGKNQAKQMLDNAGLSDLKDLIDSMHNGQFDVLWNYWGFATRLAQIGESGGHRSKNVREMDSKDRLSATEKDNIREDVKKLITEALNIPMPNVNKSANTINPKSTLLQDMRKDARAGNVDAIAWMNVNNKKY